MYRIAKICKIFLCVLFGIIVWFLLRLLNSNLSLNTTGNGGENDHSGTLNFARNLNSKALTLDEIKIISKKISQANNEQRIYNEDKFGPVTEKTNVLVIQVHLRTEYLTLLIKSLSHVRNIENCLLIISHDVYIPELNEAIQNIKFTRIIQIFYPYSIQLNPHTFPDYPDSYTQTKHHWWWKANYVFGSIRVLQNYSGVVTFLEEDHYVTPDFLWVLNLMETIMTRNLCRGCNLLAMGTYLKKWNIKSAHGTVVITNWVSSKHNMGMAFNRTLWKDLLRCSKAFCQYDDYNWDWSLQKVSNDCLKRPLTVLYAKASRIFHIGDCGMHHKKKICDPAAGAQQIDAGVKKFQTFLFPNNLNVILFPREVVYLQNSNAGWNDTRDQELCLNFHRNQTVA